VTDIADAEDMTDAGTTADAETAQGSAPDAAPDDAQSEAASLSNRARPRRRRQVQRKPRLGREDWLKAALSVLAEGGVEQVRVEPLARRIGVTKGSFYWHFKDRPDLLAALLGWWEGVAGGDLINRVEAEGGPPAERLWRLIEMLSLKQVDVHDAAMRAWARQDKAAAETLARVDTLRLDYLETLFRDMGFDRDQSMARARLVHFYQVGDETVGLKDSFGTRLGMAMARHKLLTAGV